MKLLLRLFVCFTLGCSNVSAGYLINPYTFISGSSCVSVEDNTVYAGIQAETQLYFADSWLTTVAFDVCQVDLIMLRHADDTSNYHLEIRANNATPDPDEPSSSVLATSNTVLNANIPTDAATVAFVFPTSASLSNATVYWRVLVRTGTTTLLANGVQYGNGSAEMMLGSDDGTASSWTTTKTGKAWLFDHYGE